MKTRAQDRIRESLKEAYEAGREAARHYGRPPSLEPGDSDPKQPVEEPGWHH